jgi:PERQ amino acid-rich with GYF domain-containing protein
MKPITSPVKSVSKPAALGNGKAEAGNAAMEEFNKWVTREISRGINTADSKSP